MRKEVDQALNRWEQHPETFRVIPQRNHRAHRGENQTAGGGVPREKIDLPGTDYGE